MVDLNKPGDCLRPPLNKTLPTRCQQLQKGLAQCKRGMIDMRKRFRGNMPVAMMAEQKEVPAQLYAGRPAVEVKESQPDPEDQGR